MSEAPQTLEEEVAAYRARGYEANIVDGEIHVTLGRRQAEARVEAVGGSVSRVLAPSGLPAVTDGKVLLPGDTLFGETIKAMNGSS